MVELDPGKKKGVVWETTEYRALAGRLRWRALDSHSAVEEIMMMRPGSVVPCVHVDYG